ncbi:MAG: lipocalin-like domain-containing protein [Muribaculaceae bacterium]|nr:lipocalin-like domain-containing protein [Muribaculaceae bacterium]
MKRLVKHIILTVTLLLSLSSCTHNNGDIGYWFGLWHLDSIEVDGTLDTDYDGDTYLMFQGKVFCIRIVDDVDHSYIESYARWQESDDHQSMTVSFVDDRFSPTISSHVPLEPTTKFSVITLNDKEMVLRHTHSETGVTRTYHLTRWE